MPIKLSILKLLVYKNLHSYRYISNNMSGGTVLQRCTSNLFHSGSKY